MNSYNDGKTVTNNVSVAVSKYIAEFEEGQPIFVDELYGFLSNAKKGSIRQVLKRLFDKGVVERARPGVYYKPKKNMFIAQSNLSLNSIIEGKYLISNEKVIGYRSGINFSNLLGLTTQIANVELIISNAVSKKKRMININNGKVIVNSPRVKITDQNYRLLQVLDLMNDFDHLSEVSLGEAFKAINEYLMGLALTKAEIDLCMDAYPLKAQVNFYKTGVYYELTCK